MCRYSRSRAPRWFNRLPSSSEVQVGRRRRRRVFHIIGTFCIIVKPPAGNYWTTAVANIFEISNIAQEHTLLIPINNFYYILFLTVNSGCAITWPKPYELKFDNINDDYYDDKNIYSKTSYTVNALIVLTLIGMITVNWKHYHVFTTSLDIILFIITKNLYTPNNYSTIIICDNHSVDLLSYF